MSSVAPGTVTSVEVTNVSAHGFWLLLPEGEHFVPFAQFPWFREAPIGKLLNVTMPAAHHLGLTSTSISPSSQYSIQGTFLSSAKLGPNHAVNRSSAGI